MNKDYRSEPSLNEEIAFPMTAAKALKYYMNYITDFEKGEILDFKQVYFLGINA